MTTFLLKIIAVVLMTVDHVGKFFGLPVFMRWLGRLAAPVFFFCAVEGALHTSDRKKYIKRLYLRQIDENELLSCELTVNTKKSGKRLDKKLNKDFESLVKSCKYVK